MPSPTTAWLFDVYPHPRRSSLIAWVKHGSRTTRRLVPYHPHFCVTPGTRSLEKAERFLADDARVEETWRDRTRLQLRGPRVEVLRVRPRRLQDMHAVARDLRRGLGARGFLHFDVDDRPESRWMHENGLFTMCRLKVGAGGPELALHGDEDRWTLDYPDPCLVSLRLEVHADHDGATPDFDDPLLGVRLGDEELVCDAPGDPDAEARVLRELARLLHRRDPDVLVTRHGDAWDLPYLLRRIRRLGLTRHVRLGRDADPHPDHPDQEAKSLHTYGRWLYKTHAYYLRGRWHVDLAKKTLDSEDDRKDLHGILYLARVSNRRAQDVNRNGAGYALQQMQIDHARDLGVALPWKRNLAEAWKDAATLCAVDRGGQIMNPAPGLHEGVAACDFSGYYPSLIVTHNLSSDTIGCGCCPDGPRVPELDLHVCRHQGHQSEVLRRLSPHRSHVKAILRKARAGADVDPDLVARAQAVKSEHKALGVVCFGYFRYRNARFGCAEVHQAIQALGRAGMTRAREVAQAEGYEMVHTMTDCTFLHRPGVTRRDALHIARRISREVGVPMDVEGVYRWIVFLPSKTHTTTSDVGVPNRYYGKFEDGTLKVRGIEVQRHSTPDWVHDAQQGMLDVLQEADDAAGFHARLPRALEVAKEAAQRLRARDVDPRALGITVQVRMGAGDYAANTATRAALRRLRAAGIERQPGQHVRYVILRGSGPWESRIVPVEFLGRRPMWFDADHVPYDVDSYLRLLARSVETLVAPFGYEEEPLLRWLAGRAASPKPRNAALRTASSPVWARP